MVCISREAEEDKYYGANQQKSHNDLQTKVLTIMGREILITRKTIEKVMQVFCAGDVAKERNESAFLNECFIKTGLLPRKMNKK